MELLSDVNFAYGIDKSARQHAIKTNAKTYYYRYFDINQRFCVHFVTFYFYFQPDLMLTPD